jgi:hypothetical protein
MPYSKQGFAVPEVFGPTRLDQLLGCDSRRGASSVRSPNGSASAAVAKA